MDAVLDKAGMCQLTRNFVGTLAQNRRLFAIKAMIAAYQALLAAKRGEATAEVVSVKPLTKKQLEAIAAALSRAGGI